MNTDSDKNIPYLLACAGITILLTLAAYGSCDGMTIAGTASSLYAQKKSVLTYSYIAIIITSSIFFQAFILVMLILNRMDEDYNFSKGIYHLAACTILGFVCMIAGKIMGSISNSGFRMINKKPGFSLGFTMMFVSAEILVLFAFLAALMIVFKA